MEVFFILTLTFTLFFTVIPFLSENIIKRKAFFITAISVESCVIILAILGISRVWDVDNIRFIPLFTALLGALIIPLLRFNLICKARIKFAVKAVALVFLAEAFLFNFNSFHLIFGDYSQNELKLSTANLTNITQDGDTIDSGKVVIEFEDIGYPVGTFKINGYSDKSYQLKINVDIKDDTHSARYRSGIARITILDYYEKSQTIPCHFSGNVRALQLRFDVAQDEEIHIEEIIVNSPIVWNFSLIRFFAMLILVFFIKIMTSRTLLSKTSEKNPVLFKAVFFGITIGFIIIAILISLTYRIGINQHYFDDFAQQSGNQITKEIVDAFEQGQVNLLTEPSDELLQLENPYDYSQRKGVNYLWDHVLFEGKYYSYYGIAPVVLLFLPYHLMTGFYFPSVWAILLFGIIGIVFLSKLYKFLIEEFFQKSPLPPVIVGLLAIQSISGIWFCFNTPNFYEIAQTSGFAFITSGAYFLLSSNVVGKGKIKLIRLATSTTLLSLAVLCRPTLATYCIVALFFVWAGFRRIFCDETAKNKVWLYMKYFACAMVPFVVIGSVQMIYNYLRFGSILEFGIQYSLTINDFINAQYHHHFSGIGFFNYLFAFPSTTQNFPFITSAVQTFNPNGYYFVATNTAIGMLWKFIPIVAYAYAYKAYKHSENVNKKRNAFLIVSSCVVVPFVIVFSIWESGYGARYLVDFGWQFILGAMIIILILWSKMNEQAQRIINRILVFSVIICIILCFAQSYNWIYSNANSGFLVNLMDSFGRVFEFWK